LQLLSKIFKFIEENIFQIIGKIIFFKDAKFPDPLTGIRNQESGMCFYNNLGTKNESMAPLQNQQLIFKSLVI
jgi:hypothetical protein